jgi:hypothetical protein
MFEELGAIRDIERIAAGSSIREIHWLRKVYGQRRWRKLKGTSQVRLPMVG